MEVDFYGYGYEVDVGVGDEGVDVAVGFGVLRKIVETDCLLGCFFGAVLEGCEVVVFGVGEVGEVGGDGPGPFTTLLLVSVSFKGMRNVAARGRTVGRTGL